LSKYQLILTFKLTFPKTYSLPSQSLSASSKRSPFGYCNYKPASVRQQDIFETASQEKYSPLPIGICVS
jgi:hypothetical protein